MVKIGLAPGLRSLAVIIAALGGAPLAAGTASGTMAVTATVEESCNLHAGPMSFGALSGEHGTIDARSSVMLACTPEASYLVTMDDGRHGGGGARRMVDASGTSYLAYEIYSDPARTMRWGASAASGGVGAIAPASGQVELDVYARLAAGRTPAGAYSDTITVTVAF